ncbi:hypothetical protein FGG08_007095 [Glutinoglossum americanum]|uniref:Methyltransferase n=1 Tax=Glutinoglossum americanum TaxID=1670608 RepID=A0A9P8L1A7_9PEZI|nr:hypothetical protein FGG08_007095 [Glutinoglossum americanum]
MSSRPVGGGSYQQPLEADQVAAADDDSSYGDALGSFTTSLKSSVTNYQYENGRRYHAFRSGSYPLPNDDAESQRLDIFHHMINLSLNGVLHLAPIGNPERILDIGTGTGTWAIEMVESTPPNRKGNINMLIVVDRHTKPGGWVEFQDLDIQMYSEDNTFPESLDLKKWNVQLIDGYRKLAREPCPGPLLEGWLKGAGFQNITHKQFKLPAGAWPKDKHFKEVGSCNLLQLLEGFEAFSLAPFTRALGWSADEVQLLLNGVRKDVQNPKVHSLYDLHVVYAQKPA